MNDFDALVATARKFCDARGWLHHTSPMQRDLIASLAAATYHTKALDFRDDPKLIRTVYRALQKPSVLLGVGTCAYCGAEDVNDACPDASCESNRPVPARGRDHRGWVRR